MKIRSLILFGWLFLFTAHLAEQAICPILLTEVIPSATSSEPMSYLYQADRFSDLFLVPVNYQITAPVPVIREAFFKWKLFLPEKLLNPFSATGSYPELVQDAWRCPAVAIVLFPYHEFL